MQDIFLCYDETDESAADEICRLFEDNGLSCWFKSRDFTSGSEGEVIPHVITDSKVFVLVYSINSVNSDSVLREVNRAFGRKVPIHIFNIDDTGIYGNLEYYLNNQYNLPIFPNFKGKLKKFVKDTSEVAGKPIGKVRISRSCIRFFRQFEPKSEKLLRYVKIAVPVLVVLALVVWFVVIPSGHHVTDDGEFTMNITNVDVKNLNGKYVYTVLGDAYNMPSDSNRYIMEMKFYDSKNNKVFDLNSTCDEFRGGVLATFNVDSDNITRVDFRLVDFGDEVICTQNYAL